MWPFRKRVKQPHPFLQIIEYLAKRQMEANMSNAVASPQHYVQGHIEAIYVIEQVLGKDGFKQFCMGNYLKYRMRHEHKNGEEDLAKAMVYLNWATNGLPAPVNNRVPRSDVPEQAKAKDVPSLSALLQNELDATDPNAWRVESVVSIPIGRHSKIVAHVKNLHTGHVQQGVLDNVAEGARYGDIVFDLLEEFRKQ